MPSDAPPYAFPAVGQAHTEMLSSRAARLARMKGICRVANGIPQNKINVIVVVSGVDEPVRGESASTSAAPRRRSAQSLR